LLVKPWIAHPPPIVADVMDAFPRLFVLARVGTQRLYQRSQAARIEFIIPLLNPGLARFGVAEDDLADGAEVLFRATIYLPYLDVNE
jgi:hypothetical protein